MSQNNNKYARAIYELTGGIEYIWNGDNFEDIQWIDKTKKAPTEAEVKSKIIELEIQDIEDVKTLAANKLELLNKLGITEDEAKLLIS